MVYLELLAPAKSYEYGVAAINSGADALYIGAPQFGARNSAGNSLEDIARLVEYAHKFSVKVYVTLNTLLFDNELEQARAMAHKLVEMGCDALIIQDMAYAMMGLDIPLHASTQAAASTVDKVRFIEEAGFERVILERFSSLEDIAKIRAASNIEIEAFVHGAICVAESGQCYMGQALSGRSGNRGVCSQLCRVKYNLVDGSGKVLIKDKHLLSLLDLNLSHHIPQLVDAGVTSFKIEGRLKDIVYLKNSVGHYRKELDKFISCNSGYKRSSVGDSQLHFTPNPSLSFSRSFTSYFISGSADGKLASFATPKAMGEYVGVVERKLQGGEIVISTNTEFVGGDGLCFINPDLSAGGSSVNSYRRQGNKSVVALNNSSSVVVGAKLYRNYNKVFSDKVTVDGTVRKIGVTIEVSLTRESVTLRATDIDGVTVIKHFDDRMDEAKNPEKVLKALTEQLSKSGDTIFEVLKVDVNGDSNIPFIAISQINSMRRELLIALEQRRLESYSKPSGAAIRHPKPYCELLDGRANITNSLSKEFYSLCGFKHISDGYDLSGVPKDAILMECRYCLRNEIGECLQKGGNPKKLFIEGAGDRFELLFSCKECRMRIKRAESPKHK